MTFNGERDRLLFNQDDFKFDIGTYSCLTREHITAKHQKYFCHYCYKIMDDRATARVCVF